MGGRVSLVTQFEYRTHSRRFWVLMKIFNAYLVWEIEWEKEPFVVGFSPAGRK